MFNKEQSKNEDPVMAAIDKIKNKNLLTAKGIELVLDLVQQLKDHIDELENRIDYLENLSQEKHLKH